MAAQDARRRDSYFKTIVQAEVDVINRRREALNRERLPEVTAGPGAPPLDVTALALSGGGIRSASFAMGALQALNEQGCLQRIDYLSTVSGGGYMGSALSATMTSSKGRFEFGESTGKRAKSDMTDVKDSPAVGHVRNYSNYLIPFGLRDFLTAVAIIVRGLVANIALVLPAILVFAAATIFMNPDRTDLLQANLLGFELTWLKVPHFGITLLLALAAFPIFFGWAIWRSLASASKQGEFRTWLPTLAAAYLVVVAATFFCEMQPFLVAGMFDLADEANSLGEGEHSILAAFLKRLAAIATPVAALVTLFRQQVGTLLASVTKGSGITKKLMYYAAQAAIWIAGAALPLLIWVGYLYLCYWGIINDAKPEPKLPPRAAAIHGTIQVQGPGLDLKGTIDCRPSAQNPCGAESAPPQTDAGASSQNVGAKRGEHTPSWLINTATVLYKLADRIIPASWRETEWFRERLLYRPVTLLYTTFGIVLLVIAWLLLTPNANSLHRLYRDRLSKAFLFDPNRRAAEMASRSADGVDLGRDFEQLDTMRISALAPSSPETPYAPYHLINAALNIQGSDYANRRGRNADFFLFSPLYVGSEATGYANTVEHETETSLDLPTAMAISGAAFSSNMGANSIRALTPTLALLNVRTGYWLKNPLSLNSVIGPEQRAVRRRIGSKAYLWSEISGRLYEDSPDVYITDGGHIENLGVYELLRRRCKIIVVVDAEADPSMRMPSFIALQRYARIDLGVRINMPWDEIRKSTICWMGHGGTTPAKDEVSPTPRSGPHAAIGTIDYDGGQMGWLLYIKSSLSGDENDYVRDYARRYDQFPHESTGDQFFSEEQFEVYRALGFHIMSRLLGGEDELQVYGMDQHADINSTHANVKPVSEALLGPAPAI